jgi:hypothetical protein
VCTSRGFNRTPQHKATTSRPVLGPIQPPINLVSVVLSAEVKRPGLDAVEVKNAWSSTSSPLFVFMTWCLSILYITCCYCVPLFQLATLNVLPFVYSL